ncbi:MAG: Rpn family recombination-promoting nuclease/putative transposase [Planctomycetes bacterium]|nr:Rpn family recombination-promoting nuclease/putative transposase [Planctomycetota bacterium]
MTRRGDPRHAEGLLRSALPAEIAACIDWSTLTPVPAEFVDRELREHRADLLFSARMLDCEVYLYVLVEHRSTDQRFLAFDMLRYVVRVLERHRATHPGATQLPMVIPLVVHHGDQPMRAHRRLIRLVELPREPRVLRRWLASHQPDLRLIVDDLARVSETQLRARALGATAFLSLFRLSAENGKGVYVRLLSWLYETADLAPARVAPLLTRAAGSVAEELMTTTAERLRREASLQLVQRLLTRRFGPLAPSHEEILRAASAEDLERWALRLLDARSIEEVFVGD